MKLFCIYLKLKEVPEEIRRIEEGLGKYREEYDTNFPDENLKRTIIIYAENADDALNKFKVQHHKDLDLYNMKSVKIIPVDEECVFVIKTINGKPIDNDFFKFKINSKEDGIIFWETPICHYTSIFDTEFSKLHASIDNYEMNAILWISINMVNQSVIETEYIDSVLARYQSKIEADNMKDGI